MQVRKTCRKIWFQKVTAPLLAIIIIAGCGKRGVYHEVKKGQTLYRIALTYKVPLEEIVDENSIDDPFKIDEGQLIFVPRATRVLHVPVITPPLSTKKAIFIWPVNGTVTGKFWERRRGHNHKGIDISAPAGTKIVAAASGKVIYTGSGFSGYGRSVIIDHQNGYMTLYAHLKRILTGRGRRVRRGEVIGRVGKSGRATGYHLHFEIRFQEKLVNPASYIK